MNTNQTIGELNLHSFGTTTKHAVAWVPNYGVTCSSLFTSNGSLAVVARGLESYLDTTGARRDDPGRFASLELNGQLIGAGQVEAALKAACASANESTTASI